MTLATYRGLLRAARIAFQGDGYVLNAALVEARRGFESNRGLSAESEEAKGQVKRAQEIATILRQNVVQGKLGLDGRYKLRIHDEIERGDNESVKTPKATSGCAGCSS